ncbi:MAG: hypothetical protein AVDCRST_MAG12-1553 [uncultured Rubrobacteraceae bacterium]|uniref:Uncharacterized protein n=1 Tax=uncultured Rubrobacteraceae bacterium TaxID=349277 RepID=A0A6J4RUD6_9ACTN|nr:MAG: hypothetical protein AVDCRST_MAG12-1553 [uncultured Rubrobacteraceae bacterium]
MVVGGASAASTGKWCHEHRDRRRGILLQDKNADTCNLFEASSGNPGLIELARARMSREHRLSDEVHAAQYAAASLGHTPYVALPNVGVIVVQRRGWGC